MSKEPGLSKRKFSGTPPPEPQVGKSGGWGSPPPEPQVDLRIIDFAHTTLANKKSHAVHHGPDAGFLRGLDSLHTFLTEILKENQ